MANVAFTNFETISKIHNILANIEDTSPLAYVFFSLIFRFGIKQDDIMSSQVSNVFSDHFSDKYPDVDLSGSSLKSHLPSGCENKTFREILPTRDYLHKILNNTARSCGLTERLNARVLQKTWAYVELMNDTPISTVMAHFSYCHSIYSFLTNFLGLSFNDCRQNTALFKLYASACFSELATIDFKKLNDEQVAEFLGLLDRILDLVGFPKE